MSNARSAALYTGARILNKKKSAANSLLRIRGKVYKFQCQQRRESRAKREQSRAEQREKREEREKRGEREERR